MLSANSVEVTAEQDAILDNIYYQLISESTVNLRDILESDIPTTPTAPLLPFIPAEQEEKTPSQLVNNLGGGNDGFIPLGAAPYSVEQPSNPHSVSGASNQGQNPTVYPQSGGYGGYTLQGAGPLNFMQPYPYIGAPTIYQGAHYAMQTGPLNSQPYIQGQYNNAPVMQPQQGPTRQSVGVLNGDVIYTLPGAFSAPSLPVAPPHLYNNNPAVQLPQGRKPVSYINRRFEQSQQVDQPYINKPPNAFMLYMKEQRPRFVDAIRTTGTAGVNKLIGQMWKSLSKEKKAKYFEEAYKEKLLHNEKYPNWSTRNNYGKKKKRIRTKAAKVAAASEPKSGALSQPVKKQCVTPASSGVVVSQCWTPYARPETAITENVSNMLTLPVVASKVVDSSHALVASQNESCLGGISKELLELFNV